MEAKAIEIAKRLEALGVRVLVQRRETTIEIHLSTIISLGCLTLHERGIWDGIADIAPKSIKAIGIEVGGTDFVLSIGKREIIYQS